VEIRDGKETTILGSCSVRFLAQPGFWVRFVLVRFGFFPISTGNVPREAASQQSGLVCCVSHLLRSVCQVYRTLNVYVQQRTRGITRNPLSLSLSLSLSPLSTLLLERPHRSQPLTTNQQLPARGLQRCADPKIMSPHEGADFDQRSASTCAVERYASADSPRPK